MKIAIQSQLKKRCCLLQTVLLTGFSSFAATEAKYMYVPKTGDGVWEWNVLGNWQNRGTPFRGEMDRLPGSDPDNYYDKVYLFTEPLSEQPIRIPEGTSASCDELIIGSGDCNVGTMVPATNPILVEVCGAFTNRSMSLIGYVNEYWGKTRSSKIDIPSGSWTSLGDFNIGGGTKYSWLNIGESGTFYVPDAYMNVGYANYGGGVVTNKGSLTANNMRLGFDYSKSQTKDGNTTGIVVNAVSGVMNVTNDLLLGCGKNSYAKFENRGTLNVGHHLHLGCTNNAVSEFDNYGTVNVYREFKLGMGSGAKASVYRHHEGASLSKTVVQNYRSFYVGNLSPGTFIIDGGSFEVANKDERFFLAANSSSATGRLEIVNGGSLSFAGPITLGLATRSHGTLRVDGEGSELKGSCWINAGNWYSWNTNVVRGRGDIIVSNKAKMSVSSVYLGFGGNAVGTLTVSGGGVAEVTGSLGIGYLSSDKGAVTGIVTVAGADSVITNVRETTIGRALPNNFGLLKMEGGKYFYVAEEGVNSIFHLGVDADSSAGEIRGWGLITYNKINENKWPGRSVHMVHFGKVIADGEGVERDLDMGCMWSLGEGSVEPNRIGCNGWYARHKGRLRMPHLHEVYEGSNSRCVGDYAAYAGDPRLVNSFRFTLSGMKKGGKFIWTDLYAPDRSDIPSGLASRTELGKALAVYRVGYFEEGHKLGEPVTPVGFDSGTMKFHYSPEESEEYPRVRVYHHDGTENGSWRLIGSTAVSEESPFVETTTFKSSAAHWNFGWFAVVADRPRGTVLSVR